MSEAATPTNFEHNYRDPEHVLERVNLFLPHFEDDAPGIAPLAAVTVPEFAGDTKDPRPARNFKPLYLGVGGALMLGLVGYGLVWSQTPAPVVARASPSPTPKATASPAPSPTATPTAAPTPIPTNTAVSAPAAVPTAEKPQSVTITSKSGLWLRSTPNSSNKSNIIGWMPNGSTVSVDQVGSFWWHGTFKGQAGYFAVNYTQ